MSAGPTTPAGRYRVYQLGAALLVGLHGCTLWALHRWSLLMLQGLELEEYTESFRRGFDYARKFRNSSR